MLKADKKIIRIVIILDLILMGIANGCYATTVSHTLVEAKSGPGSTILSRALVYNGHPKIKYVITTEGLRVNGNNSIEDVLYINNVVQTRSGISVQVKARCLPSNQTADVSLSGSSLKCEFGESLRVTMLAPAHLGDPGRYYYVGTLTIINEEETNHAEDGHVLVSDTEQGSVLSSTPSNVSTSVRRTAQQFGIHFRRHVGTEQSQ